MLKHKKVVSSIVAMLSAVSLLGGCGGGNKTASTVNYPDGATYPMECEDTLTVWSTCLPGDMNASALGKAWSEQTGAKLTFEQPVGGMESLNTLLASGELPDIMITAMSAAPGGVSQQVEDGVIIELDDYLEKYAPNLMKYLEENPEVDKMIKSDDGHYYYFPFVRGDERLTASQGIALRGDMLKKANLDVPETIDEWYEVLKAFKAQGAEAPLSYDMINEESTGYFFGAYGVMANFYLDGDTVKYGFMEDGMKDALTTFNKWYNEGLLDHNIVSVPDLDGQILTSKTAASVMWAGSGLGKYMTSMANDPSFELIPVQPPVLKKGELSKFGSKGFLYSDQGNAYITTDCKNVELAVRFLDYGFGEEGHRLLNFGVEGESYTMVDGKETYTENIINPADGKSMSEALKEYVLASGSGPFVQDYGYIEQYYQLDQQKQALTEWSKSTGSESKIPTVSFTSEESGRLAEITTNISTYAQEMMYKYITGSESLDNYESFKEQLKDFGVEEAIEIYQAAVDRYNKR